MALHVVSGSALKSGCRLLVACVMAVATFAATGARAQGEEKPQEFNDLTPRQEECVEKGLKWLADQQAKGSSDEGSWGSEGRGGTYRMAMTGLAGLAFLSAGHTPNRGKYGDVVRKAMEYCLKNCQNNGLINSGNDGQQMYGHGFAMTFLGELYGMEGVSPEDRARIREKLIKAVEKTGKSQSRNGGWYYSPDSGNDEGSVTITQVQALRSVRNAGIPVPDKLLNGAIDYVKKCQNSDGGIRYSIQSGQTSSPALSAAGAEVFLMAGRYDKEETRKVLEYLKKNLDAKRSAGYHDFYTHFYGAQAMYQIGGDHWVRYYAAIRDRLTSPAAQAANGEWKGDEIGGVYRTAIAVMILSIPYRYLPIFQK